MNKVSELFDVNPFLTHLDLAEKREEEDSTSEREVNIHHYFMTFCSFENKITDLKRQLSNARPYHGVMAERKIRCLNNQVKSIRCKSLHCKPKQWNENDSDDDDLYHFRETDEGERGRPE